MQSSDDKELFILHSKLQSKNFHTSHDYGFKFSKIFPEETNQDEFYKSVGKPVVKKLMEGYNGAIFAYGQTGTGKTHSIIGLIQDRFSSGIIPRVVDDIFHIINNARDYEYSLNISIVEIYNDNCYDLTPPFEPKVCESGIRSNFNRINVMEDNGGHMNVIDLEKHTIKDMNDVMSYLATSLENRVVADTPMNVMSSRSHFIFTLYVNRKSKVDGSILKSKLHMIDLAGSERVWKKKSTGLLLNEAKHINLSLHYLEQVIVALGDTKRTHIPYRNSVLTSLLRDSLGGNCCTVMVFTICLDKQYFEETLATCRFAQRVALIKTEPRIVIEYKTNETAMLKNHSSLFSSLPPKKEDIAIERELNQILTPNLEKCMINETDNNQNQNREYFKCSIDHISRGINLLSVLLKEVSSLKTIEENFGGDERFLKNFINVLGLYLPENNIFTGKAYTDEQRLSFERFLSMSSTKEALMRHFEMNTSYYRHLEEEWVLWKKEMDTSDKIRNLQLKMKTSIKYGDFPDVLDNLQKDYEFYKQKHQKIIEKCKLFKEDRKASMNIFLKAKNKFLQAFETWWLRQQNKPSSISTENRPSNLSGSKLCRNAYEKKEAKYSSDKKINYFKASGNQCTSGSSSVRHNSLLESDFFLSSVPITSHNNDVTLKEKYGCYVDEKNNDLESLIFPRRKTHSPTENNSGIKTDNNIESQFSHLKNYSSSNEHIQKNIETYSEHSASASSLFKTTSCLDLTLPSSITNRNLDRNLPSNQVNSNEHSLSKKRSTGSSSTGEISSRSSPLLHSIASLVNKDPGRNSSFSSSGFSSLDYFNNQKSLYATAPVNNKYSTAKESLKTNLSSEPIFHSIYNPYMENKQTQDQPISIKLKLTGDQDLDARIISFYKFHDVNLI